MKNRINNDMFRIAIIIVLIAGILFIGFMFRSISQEGMNCLNNPFTWGAERFTNLKTVQGHMDCSCHVYDDYGVDDYYNFNEHGRTRDSTLEWKINLTS